MSFTTDSSGGEYKHKLLEIEIRKHHHSEALMVKVHPEWPVQTTDGYGVMIDFTTKKTILNRNKKLMLHLHQLSRIRIGREIAYITTMFSLI